MRVLSVHSHVLVGSWGYGIFFYPANRTPIGLYSGVCALWGGKHCLFWFCVLYIHLRDNRHTSAKRVVENHQWGLQPRWLIPSKDQLYQNKFSPVTDYQGFKEWGAPVPATPPWSHLIQSVVCTLRRKSLKTNVLCSISETDRSVGHT